MEEITKVIIKKGRELTEDELEFINNLRRKVFNSQTAINPQPDNDEWDKKYFFLKNNTRKILAFARLHDISLKFLGKTYSIFGFATLIAAIRGQGYGQKLTLAIKNYILDRGKTCIGFCNKSLTPYYEKLGFKGIKDGVKKFRYEEPSGNLVPDKWEGKADVIYLEGKDKLVEKLINDPNQIALINRHFW
jgi:predicted GNAT family N-acyltransferase